ncbi:MAG TPA: ATP-dependent DNA helicase RecG [Candidatus Saccharimonadales bacterium]|nr:ATP-dependent DNA helicase RecG [Candidatus Saccharimonadales bacterium]
MDQPVSRLKGVGAEVERKLGRLGVVTIGDLIGHYPRRYDDFSKITPIRAMKPGLVTIKGQILTVGSRRSQRRKLTITEAIITDGTGTVKAVWFNQAYLKTTLPIGSDVLVSGRLEFKNSDLALQGPVVEPVAAETKDTARIVPVYPETEGLSSKQLRGLVLPLLPQLGGLPETLPPPVVAAARLLPRGEALTEIHFPTSMPALERARRRLAFEELFFLITTSLIIKREIKTEAAPVIEFQPEVAKRFTGLLGFKLTDAQRAAAWQILKDLDRDQPMNRLLEGDVGSGKTVVATLAAVMAIASGHQAALMVPTEILARQHFAKIEPLLAQLGYRSTLIVGKQAAADKRQATEAVASGQTNLVIGTHALLSAPVNFCNLGLVIIDEQHRFGVGQRQTLKQKAGQLPHLLSMTATPIPRSLALTVYGDLDISVIDALPPGRQPIVTQVVKRSQRDQVYQAVDAEIAAGRQVFVVCPLIEESDKLGAKSALAEAERLQKSIFGHRRIAVIHGKLAAADKQAVMERFVDGQIDILVATSVIEVGIDVPNASVMLIEGADRFGLASLHQLRGRIGRGQHQSRCYLLYDSLSPAVAQRLGAMERTSDGFRLAQIDLELRGPGQIYGLQQHGVLDLEMADIADAKLVSEVRAAAQEFLRDEEVMLQYPQIVEQVNKLKTVTSLD